MDELKFNQEMLGLINLDQPIVSLSISSYYSEKLMKRALSKRLAEVLGIEFMNVEDILKHKFCNGSEMKIISASGCEFIDRGNLIILDEI